MQDAFVAKEIFPEHILVAIQRDQVGVGEIFSRRIDTEPNVILVIHALLFGTDRQDQSLELFEVLMFPVVQIRVFFVGTIQILLPVLEGFVV